MKAEAVALLHAYFDGTLTEGELPQLQELLRESVEARRLWRTLATVEEKLQESAAGDPETLKLLEPLKEAGSVRGVWFQWRPLAAAAAGIVLGMLSVSGVRAYVGNLGGKVTLLYESFERVPKATQPGLPREAGIWSGDEAAIVPAEQGIRPKGGGKMLRFVSASYPGENASQSAWGDVYRLVDLRGLVSDPKSVLRLTANFAAGQFPVEEEYSCSVELIALETDPKDSPQPATLPWMHENSASDAKRKFPINGNGAWQRAMVEVAVTPQSRFALMHLAMQRRKPYPPTEPVRFPAHYVDGVKLELFSGRELP